MTKAERFFTGYPYIIICAAVTFAGWLTGCMLYALIPIVIVAAAVLLTQKSVKGLMPPLLFAFMGFSDLDYMLQAWVYGVLIGLALLLLVALFVFFIKNRIRPDKSLMTVGFALIFVATALGGVADGHFGSISMLIGIGIAGGSGFLFFVMASAEKGNLSLFTAKMFATLAVLVSVESLIGVARAGDIEEAIINKWQTIGWGHPNAVAMVLLTALPFLIYLINRAKRPAPYCFIFIFTALTMCLTLSRGCILIFGAALIPMIILAGRRAVNRPAVRRNIAIYSVLAVGGLIALSPKLMPLLETLLERGVGDNGRFAIWERAWSFYRDGNMWFGRGFNSAVNNSDFGNLTLAFYHCTLIQFLSDLGIFGLAAYFVHVVSKFLPVLKNRSNFNLCAGLAMLAVGLYGIIDVSYFMFYYLIPLIYVMLAVKNDNIPSEQTDSLLKEIA